MDVQAISDTLEIHDVLYDYAWACDNGDWALLRSVFTDDARLDYSSAGGPAGGRDEVCTWLEESLSQIQITHVVSNVQVDLHVDEAAVRAMFYCIVMIEGQQITTSGYYRDQFRRTSEGWKILSLTEDNRWMTSPSAVTAQA